MSSHGPVAVQVVGWGVVSLGVLLVAAQFSPPAANVVYKLRLFTQGVTHLALSRDKHWKAPPDPDAVLRRASPNGPDAPGAPDAAPNPPTTTRTKRFIYIRHGESQWNEIFNRGFGPAFPLRVLRGLFNELLALPTRSSVFFDANLSPDGVTQAVALTHALGAFAASDPDAALLLHPATSPKSSVVTSSNLRRSIATALIVLRDRLAKSGEAVVVHSALQEITVNADGIALARARDTPEMGEVRYAVGGAEFDPAVALDATYNNGSKGLGSNGLARIMEFNRWAFEREEQVVVIAGGHSLWLRTFLRTCLPHGVDHPGKKQKLVNCGCLALDVTQATLSNGDVVYRIPPESVRVVSGGFTK